MRRDALGRRYQRGGPDNEFKAIQRAIEGYMRLSAKFVGDRVVQKHSTGHGRFRQLRDGEPLILQISKDAAGVVLAECCADPRRAA